MVPLEEELLHSLGHLGGMVVMVRPPSLVGLHLHSLVPLPLSLGLTLGLDTAQHMVEGTAVEDMGDPHLRSLEAMQGVLVGSGPLGVQEGSEDRLSHSGSLGLIHTKVSRVDIPASTMDITRVDRRSLGLLVGGKMAFGGAGDANK